MKPSPLKEKKHSEQAQLFALIRTFFKHPLVIALIGIFITACATLIWRLSAVSTSVENLSKQISSQSAYMKDIETHLQSELTKLSEDVDLLSQEASSLRENIAMLNVKVFDYHPTSMLSAAITNTYDGIDAPSTSTPIKLASSSYVVYSAIFPNKEYTVSQIADQPMLLSYIENGNEIYFYGQLDETGNWNGRCIVNIYQADELKLITDAQYDCGTLTSCKQVFPDTAFNHQRIWAISQRTVEDGVSSGETWRYLRSDSYKKTFSMQDAEVSDILGADQFRSEIRTPLEGYYCGDVSNGKYNDESGNAYFIKFFEDQTVRTLYVGTFKDGQFDDMTGNAWMIGKLQIGADYSYYKGPFENGSTRKDKHYWEEPLTMQRLFEILKDAHFQCNLNLRWESPSI